MTKINQLTNLYEMQKTLRFNLAPVGETESFLNERLMVQNDERRAEAAALVKEYMNRYHKCFIESVLSSITLTDIDRYADLYFKVGKDDTDREEMNELEETLCTAIASKFQKHPNYEKMFGKEMISEILPSFLTDDEEKAIVASFKSFTVFFYDFYNTRKTFYSEEAPVGSISYRCIMDNLPLFLDNVKTFTEIKSTLPVEDLQAIEADFRDIWGESVESAFSVEAFNKVLPQTGIDMYNTLIGGYSNEDGSKVKGLNEYISIFNQRVGKDGRKLPRLKQLDKQILSEKETLSFVADKFTTDKDVICALREYHDQEGEGVMSLPTALDGLGKMFVNIHSFDLNGIYISNGKGLTDLSHGAFGKWNSFQSAWEHKYDEESTVKKKNTTAYEEKRAKAYNAAKSFSLDYIQGVAETHISDRKHSDVADYITKEVVSAIKSVKIAYDEVARYLNEEEVTQKLITNEDAICRIKAFLDAVKDVEHIVKPLLGTQKEEGKDNAFYGDFLPLYNKIASIDRLYDKVRNYVTQKPYSKEKIKLTFNVADFFSGWAQDFSSKGSHIIKQGESYYLMIVEKSLSKDDIAAMSREDAENDAIRYGYHFIKPDMKTVPRMFIRSSTKKNIIAPAVEKYNLPLHDILDIYDQGLFKAEYEKKDPAGQKAALEKVIDYFKLGFERHESYRNYTFNWKPSNEYNNINEFYLDAQRACYKLTEEYVNLGAVRKLVQEGKVYLFRFNNKDFSPFSKGKPNIHTLYFKMLFGKENLEHPTFKLNGRAEMFYRKASISESDKIVHRALYPINNKNPENEKEKSVFDYDIVKDRRYTKNQFFVHIPITLNFGSAGSDMTINGMVRSVIKNSDETYVVGIDRGEKNLVFATVIDGNGKIVEQRSFNIIRGVNYHDLLDKREKERQKARQDWTSVENIKNIKEGYISYVVREVCDLVMKYDAVIAMEDLNFGFKSSRSKIEKQVYQKFEKMLIDKMNYLIVKDRDPNEYGGLLKAYQLTSKFTTFDELRGQNGMVFFVPAWFTSKTDPVTGFADLFNVKYTTIKDAKDFFGRFTDIRYNSEEDYFEFEFSYSSFPVKVPDYRNNWVVCTNDIRIQNVRDTNTNEWKSKAVNLSESMKALFKEYAVDYTSNLRTQICDRNEKEFFERLITLFSLTVQIRNSVIGNADEDFVISPCKDKNGVFFDSRNYKTSSTSELPCTADANDAYNIARKALWAINVLKDTPDDLLPKVKLSVSNKDWLRFVQEGDMTV